ncbi:site-specific integrase [Calidifontimicrobium sp. SYSU G02091]|uniref:tyrosine-type recombinase/integrase n=1 Tax=Calidifontimicrobium sp. SYSU G02091 TaxID=2926421 RepID=UPI001F531FAE|nr:site-specific integrase [Calidifontimicrobium sp. SYSU G02091]MCI1193507.1 site-specific integrase [Calidifontimicrobium sp. SYSU G02091]
MPIRQDADGRWHVEVCIQRRRIHRRCPPGATARDAKRLEAELIRAAGAARPAVVVPGDPLLSELLADYAGRHAQTLRSPDTARYHALRIGRWVEGRRASETREVAAAIRDDLLRAYAPATVNRSLGALKKALRLAWEHGRTNADYSGLVKRLPEHNARTVSLGMHEVQRIADRASQQVRAAIWLSLFTGLRRGELLGLTRDDIGTDIITVRAGNTKTLRTRTVPIIAPARPWLQHVPLKISAEGLKTGFARARGAAGMPHVTFHDLRRSCGTLLIQHGVPLHIVSRLLGHSSTAVTERVYAHLAPEQLRAGLDVLADLHRDLHRRRTSRGSNALSA